MREPALHVGVGRTSNPAGSWAAVLTGGKILTPVIERTIEPTTWLIISGWSSTEAERNPLGR